MLRFSLILLSFILLFPCEHLHAQSTRALGTIKGLSKSGVSYIPVSSKSARMPKVGDIFFNHDQFVTDETGRVLLEFKEGDSTGNGNRVVLGASSDLVINSPESGAGTSLSLNKGSVFSNVKKKYSGSGDNEFRVVTDNGVAGVRGTKFLVTYINLRLGVAVLESTNNRGVEVRKDLFDFKDSKMIHDREVIFVDQKEMIKEIPVQKFAQMPKEVLEVLKNDTNFEGTRVDPSALKNDSPQAPRPEIQPGNTSNTDSSKPSNVVQQKQFLNEIRNQIAPPEGAERVEKAIDAPRPANLELGERPNIGAPDRGAAPRVESVRNGAENAPSRVRFQSVQNAVKNRGDSSPSKRIEARPLEGLSARPSFVEPVKREAISAGSGNPGMEQKRSEKRGIREQEEGDKRKHLPKVTTPNSNEGSE